MMTLRDAFVGILGCATMLAFAWLVVTLLFSL